MRTKAKEKKILNTAHKLFLKKGIHATGIDLIIKESKIAKQTLYNNFSSKEKLVQAVLRQADEDWSNWFEKTVISLSKQPDMQLFAIFDALKIWFESEEYAGCIFLKSLGEYPDPKDPIHQNIKKHDLRLRNFLKKILLRSTYKEEEHNLIIKKIMLLISGSIVESLITYKSSPADDGKKILESILKK